MPRKISWTLWIRCSEITLTFIVFIDDILVYSKSEDEHMDHLEVVLKVLKEHQLFAKYSKCEFWLRSVAFDCHFISSEGIEVDPKKIEMVNNWPRPLNPTGIWSFLGLYGYDRRFVDGFASIASFLTTLTQKHDKFSVQKLVKKFPRVET